MVIRKPQLKESENVSNVWFIILLLFMITVVFLRTFFNLPIPVFFILALSIIPAVLGTQSQILAFAVCCLPLSAAFQYKYALMICMVMYLLRRRGKIRVNHVTLAILLMMFWELLHAFYGEFSILEYIRGFAELLFLVVVVGMDMESVDYKLIIRSLALCTIAVCLTIFILKMRESGWSITFLVSNFRLGEGNIEAENFGLTFNANRLGFICNLSITGLLILYSRKESKLFDIIMIIMLAIFGFMTLSRTYVICLIVVVICFLFMLQRSVKRSIVNAVGVVAVCAVVILTLSYFFPSVFSGLEFRFQDSDLLSGRDDLLIFYNEHIWSSFAYCFLGLGLQDYGGKIADIYDSVWQVCHNGFQEIWVVWGIVGLIMFTYMMIALLRTAKQYSKKQNAVQYIPLIMFIVNVSAGQLISAGQSLLALVFIYICLCIKSKGYDNDNSYYKV